MAYHAETGEYTPGSCSNSRHPTRHPPRHEMRLDSPALRSEQYGIPIEKLKEPRFFDGAPESPQEHCHKTR